MGLDRVELACDLESHFRIRLDDVRRAIAELIGADLDEITASTRLDEDLGLD